MSDALLDYYQRELAFIRQLGTEFAKQYPKIAGRIRLGPDRMDDPLVGRLMESCALMNARIRQKLDDETQGKRRKRTTHTKLERNKEKD